MSDIRELTDDDLPAVIEIERLSFSHPWPPEAFQDLNYSDSLIIHEQDRVIGYLMYHRVLDECVIVNFAIDPAHQGKGSGSHLLATALERIAGQNIRYIYLDVRISNSVARHLYERAGFRRMGIRKGYYSHPDEDSLVMVKVLDTGNKDA